jgi:hypothetical protein
MTVTLSPSPNKVSMLLQWCGDRGKMDEAALVERYYED